MTPRTPSPRTYGEEDGFATTEVRWFAQGALSSDFRSWFTEGPTLVESRSDRYRLDGLPDVGLKSRNHGALEVKVRRPSDTSIGLDGRLAGPFEEWVKIHNVDEADFPAADSVEWVDVDKQVFTRSYAASDDTSLEVLLERTLDVPGCDIEIADVVVAGISAWTFGLEAWGPQEHRQRILCDSMDNFCQSWPLLDSFIQSLGPAMGYPEWLESLRPIDGSPVGGES